MDKPVGDDKIVVALKKIIFSLWIVFTSCHSSPLECYTLSLNKKMLELTRAVTFELKFLNSLCHQLSKSDWFQEKSFRLLLCASSCFIMSLLFICLVRYCCCSKNHKKAIKDPRRCKSSNRNESSAFEIFSFHE